MIYIITPTGGRPDALLLLAGYINRQTYSGPMHWIIVDDVDPPSKVPTMRDGIRMSVIYPPWRWSGANTQAQSMACGLEHVPDDASLIVMEDDDWYSPQHIETRVDELQTSELVGERVARYYNVASMRYRIIPSIVHSSLAATACRGGALALLRHICESGSRRIDIDLWSHYQGHLSNTAHVVGIKGLPGRAGIGVGHRKDFGTHDPDGGVLAEWIGRDVDNYL